MIEVKGQFNAAICYTPKLEKAAESQIKAVCDQKAFSDCKIRIMPDVHAGMTNSKLCAILTTETRNNYFTNKSHHCMYNLHTAG